MFVGMALALAAWAFARDVWSLAAFALVYGAFYGGWVAIFRPLSWTISAAAMSAR